MEVDKVLHMVGGEGDTSYAANCELQRKALLKAKSMVEQAIWDMCTTVSTERMAVADLGCSSGPNTFLLISEILNAIDKCRRAMNRSSSPEIHFFLNDLPGNDFNAVFRSIVPFRKELKLEDGGEVAPFFVSGVPGSFYGRILPKGSLHFVHSSNSVHYLSQIPPRLQTEIGISSNKSNIYLTKTSPPSVVEAYLEQFQRDFSLFLNLRAEELVPGGHMVLTLVGRENVHPNSGECCYILEALAETLKDMALEGLIQMESLNRFNIPFYSPSIDELKGVIQQEGSFCLNAKATFELNWDPFYSDSSLSTTYDDLTSGKNVARLMRAVMEPMLIDQFKEVDMDEVICRYAKKIVSVPKENRKYVFIKLSLKKI